LRWLSPEEIREYEPHAAGIRGLAVPQTGIVDYKGVARTYAQNAIQRGCQVKTGARVIGCAQSGAEIVLETRVGDVHCKTLVNCAGLQCDRVAMLCGVETPVRIIPFRGEYYELLPSAQHLVRNLIYPVPDPEFPFLGVHFTRMIAGGIEAGPNAVLALKREGYRKTDISVNDVASLLAFPGFWRMAGRYYQTGTGELWRSLSKSAFVRALQRLLPELKPEHVRPGGSGVRAQAVDPKGNLLDDFSIVRAPRMVHVLNAPSPGATSSLSIGKAIAEMALEQFGR
jgi:L-2-hydroxyglutarate oxidase